MKKKYAQFLDVLIEAQKDGIINLLHRGETKEFAFNKLNLDTSYNSLEQFAEKIFYFGDKAKYFWKDKVALLGLEFEINDISDSVFENIFLLFNKMIQFTRKEATLIYLKKNMKTESYFKDIANIENFKKRVNYLTANNKLFYRNYYLRLLHQLGEGDYTKNSLLISSSEEKHVAKKFSKNNIIINFWDLRFNNRDIFVDNMPIFIGKPYKNQKEISIFATILPHYIYSVEYKGIIFPNPALKTTSNFESVVLSGFEIMQENFLEKLQKETKYNKGVSMNGEKEWEIE